MACYRPLRDLTEGHDGFSQAAQGSVLVAPIGS